MASAAYGGRSAPTAAGKELRACLMKRSVSLGVDVQASGE